MTADPQAWSNTRMKHIVNRVVTERCGARRGTGRIGPKDFVVRWQDEDAGWKTVCIRALSEHAARAEVERLVNRADLIVSRI